ncbi:MAG: hypothetical protein ABIX28_09655 [Vicinamibacterales bacterium]
MVQFTIAYVALGFAVLLVLGAAFALVPRSRPISPTERIAVLGGLSGMAVLIVVAFLMRR